ncbi:hypothetical protein Tco_1501250 [Tanacetum coccineum]
MNEFPQLDSGIVVPMFTQGDDPISCLNKAMAFLSAVVASRFHSTNNQLITSSNPRNEATIQDGIVTLQQVQGRQGQSYAGICYKGNATSFGEIMQEDPGILDSQAAQTTILNITVFQTDDLDAYDSDCDDVSNAQAVLMANLSNYGSEVISEAPLELPKVSQKYKKFLTRWKLVFNSVFKIYKKQLCLENDRLLHQIMSQDVMLCVMNSTVVFGDSVNLEMQSSESCDKCFDLDDELFKKQNAYNELLKSYSQLEKYCISHELSMQLNQEIFQKDKSCDNQNALEIPEYFENNNLKAQLQAKDTTITVRFGNDQIARIMDYGDYQLGNLAKDGLARGIPKLKFKKDHLCSACALGKSKKSSYQPKAEDTNQEKLYLLHMDLCGPISVDNINGKKYILVIVDDYS